MVHQTINLKNIVFFAGINYESSENTGISILTSSISGVVAEFSYLAWHSIYSEGAVLFLFVGILAAALYDTMHERVHVCDRCGKRLMPKPMTFKPHNCKSKLKMRL